MLVTHLPCPSTLPHLRPGMSRYKITRLSADSQWFILFVYKFCASKQLCFMLCNCDVICYLYTVLPKDIYDSVYIHRELQITRGPSQNTYLFFDLRARKVSPEWNTHTAVYKWDISAERQKVYLQIHTAEPIRTMRLLFNAYKFPKLLDLRTHLFFYNTLST